MTMDQIIKQLMKEEGVTQAQMARFIGAKSQSVVAQTFVRDSEMNLRTANKMLYALGYELVVQKVKPGKRPEGQIVVEAKK